MTADDDTLLEPEQLRIGLYVSIDLPWFKHPFAFSRFKIRNQEQLDTLRELGVPVRYVPSRSDCRPLPREDDIEPETLDLPGPSSEEIAAAAAVQARVDQVKALSERVHKVEQRMQKAAGAVRQINKVIRASPREAFELTDDLVYELVNTLADDGHTHVHAIHRTLGEDIYFHSLNVAVLSMLLGQALGLDKRDLRHIGFGALLHDVGLCEVPDQVLGKQSALNKIEQVVYESHCKAGVKIARRLGLRPQALDIIAHHHERVDGSGYPDGLSAGEMSLPVQIVALVNAYDNLCNPRHGKTPMTPYEALSFLFAKQREQFGEQLVQQLVRCLGVYPPGTLVQLTDERIGLVVSVNGERPLQPVVLVYDPDVPREQAHLLDLDVEPELRVTKGLRPQNVPRAALEYLDPRSHVTFFFERIDASVPAGPA
ncbi:MAG TPA: HD domain-containing phosphohydrolase [Arenimonas sp.]|nr:HD domain-containing phosphohydrolase [Arenimonas sp.]